MLQISPEEFQEWYDAYREDVLEPAKSQFEQLLAILLGRDLNQYDAQRIRMAGSRIKSAPRLFRKLGHERYAQDVRSTADIPTVIDDLIGMRLTCNNTKDLEYARAILESLPTVGESDDLITGLAIEEKSNRDYCTDPKDSGYRAYHVNLVTGLIRLEGQVSVRAELQVRTLLQHAWGELTHEDTYKPGTDLPQLAEPLARRMADLLSVIDTMADDIRDAIDDSVKAALLRGEGDRDPLAAETDDDESAVDYAEPSRDSVLVTELRKLADDVTSAVPLATFAQQLMAAFGPDIAQNWAGYGSFKRLVSSTIPPERIIDTTPGYIVPEGHAVDLPSNIPTAVLDPSIPSAVRALRQSDSAVPALSGERLTDLLWATEQSLKPETWDKMNEANRGIEGVARVNYLSRWSRDQAASEGRQVSRRHMNYVLMMLHWTGNLNSSLDLRGAIAIMGRWMSAKAASLGATDSPQESEAEIVEWLLSGLPSHG